MRRMVLVAALAFGALALAQEGGQAAPPAGEGDREVEHEMSGGPHAGAPGAPDHALPPGERAEHEKLHEEREDVAAFILHHVSNATEYEFEIPLNAHGENPKLVFPDWRISLKAPGCPADRHAEVPLTQCLDLSLTKHAFMMMIAAVLLVLLLWSVPHRDRTQLVPKGRKAHTVEYLVTFVRKIAIENIGKEKADQYTPFLLSAFFFILAMNFIGLIPEMATPTGNLGVTAALALCTFVLTQIASVRAGGFLNYLKHLTGGVHWVMWPIMVPVEIMGLFTKPFALTVRLYANMVAGHIVIFFLLGLIFIMQSPLVAGVSVPFAIGIYFLEIFVAVVQAYIFTMLSALFIGMGVAMGHHDDHPHPENHGADHHIEGAHTHDHGRAQQLGGF